MTETNKIPEAAFSGVAQENPRPAGTPSAVEQKKVNDTSTAQQVAEMIALGKVLLDSDARVIIEGQYFLVIYDAGKKVVKIKVLQEKGWVIMTESTQGYPTVVEAVTKRANEYMDNKLQLISEAHALETAQAKYNESFALADKDFDTLGEIAKEAMKTVDRIRKG